MGPNFLFPQQQRGGPFGGPRGNFRGGNPMARGHPMMAGQHPRGGFQMQPPRDMGMPTIPMNTQMRPPMIPKPQVNQLDQQYSSDF
jgi:hypothetical protein